MQHLSIDIETYSDIDLRSAGLFKYVEDKSFEVLLIAYSIDFGEVDIIDLTESYDKQEFADLVTMLKSKNVIKHAYNAQFEITCLSKLVNEKLDHSKWRCTMIHGAYLGLPIGLDKIGEALSLPKDKAKMKVGKALINYFCKPCKPTKANGKRTRNLPEHDWDKWELFKEYCIRDVETEVSIYDRIRNFKIPYSEWENWFIDQKINCYGVNTDSLLIDAANELKDRDAYDMQARAKEITGLSNPNSNAQLKSWLDDRLGYELPNMQKGTIAELLAEDLDSDIKEVLEIKSQSSKTSLKKYNTMAEMGCSDNRIRGLFQFYGANRTGRWSGRGIQPQNLPRNYINVEFARNEIKKVDINRLRILYGDISDVLSQVIRTSLIPSEGNKFVVSDFSAIEARVIAWLAQERWVMDVFATHGKIYEATASQMFHVPIELIKKGNPEYALRQKGKVATLALGYGGGAQALISMGALNMGIEEDELSDIVSRWREANPKIKSLWRRVEKAAINTVETGIVNEVNGLIFTMETDLLYGYSYLSILLPSGRKLYYYMPEVGIGRFDTPSLFYYQQKATKLEKIQTWGGTLVENVVQAIARDCLALAIKRVDTMCPGQIVMHIHDEVVIDAPKELKLEKVNEVLGLPIDWAKGLILTADGFESEYYMKD